MPFVPFSMRSMPFSQVLGVAPLQPQHVAPTSPDTNTMTGESTLSILPSQFVSYIRPTVGVDHTSVWFGSVTAVGPHDHLTIASRLPVALG